LNERANQIAHHLIEQGAGPEVLVGIFLERNSDLIPAILGVLKSGSAYVPLDPSYPRDRLAAILQDAKATVVLTQQSLRAQVAGSASSCICIDADWHQFTEQSRENPRVAVGPQNLGYVLFTSGSTGRPKGVALEHHSAVTFIRWAQTVFTAHELAGVLLSTSICFDLSIFEIFVPLSVGGKLIVVQNALYLPTAQAKDEVTLINTVPSAIAELVRMKAVPDAVKTINLAGEALPDSLVNEIYASTAVEKVYNLYGPTEDTTYSTYTLTRPNRHVTIGKPLPNTQAYVLDAQLNPRPIGVPGELYLAGEGLARGYYGRSDLTAERFVRNPFSSEVNARMYRTGDLCRWLADGNLEYLGRLDQQIKLRGFRIELGEIEGALASHAQVRQALVIAREDRPGEKRLVAYVVPQAGQSLSWSQLRTHLRQTLPDYMVPSALVELEALPLTANGKLDRNRLPAPAADSSPTSGRRQARTPREEILCAIWTEVLTWEEIGMDDNFFELGGHSLLATQVVSRIRQSLGLELPLRAVFEAPTIAGLADKLQQVETSINPPVAPNLKPVPRTQPPPLSYAQQRLWFLDQLHPNSPAYNIAYTLRISGTLDPEILSQSVLTLIARHETLRTSFFSQAEQPAQMIHDSVQLPLLQVDLSALPQSEQEEEARRTIAAEANRPFDLTEAPLLRITLIRLGDDEHYLLINIHHIISDRWSIGLICHELVAIYEATSQGAHVHLHNLGLQYADYAVWQREWLQGDPLETQLAYWRDKLRGAPSLLEFPTDRPRPAIESSRGDSIYVSLPPELTAKLKQLSRRHGSTLFMTLLAGFQAVLSRYCGSTDIVVGTAVANRNHPELEKIIGYFTNTLALRADLSGDPCFLKILDQVKETALGAYAHQDVPFEKIVEELNPERSLSYSPLVQIF
ncbi:MAG: amino acid adenylation domain-containing protein, partial [Acidobacteria bacterium]|nr:amino acid adenylation domain-containing protein [Acidobacteriota bacterium]